MKFDIQKYNTKKRITALLNHLHTEDERKITEEATNHATYLMLDDDKGYRGEEVEGVILPAPYYILEGSYGNGRDYDPDNLFIEWVKGYHDGYKYGDIREYNGEKYEYLDSERGIEEAEFQCERDGHCWYWNIGYNYIRIWLKVEEEEKEGEEG